MGQAVLKNKQLAEYLSHRLANISPEENYRGAIDIQMDNGITLTFRFAPPLMRESQTKQIA